MAVDLRRRVLDEALALPHAEIDDAEVGQEVEFEHLERGLHVDARIGMGDQVDDHVRATYDVLEDLRFLGGVRRHESETGPLDSLELVASDVEADDLVFALGDEGRHEVRPHESAGAEDGDVQRCSHSWPYTFLFSYAARATSAVQNPLRSPRTVGTVNSRSFRSSSNDVVSTYSMSRSEASCIGTSPRSDVCHSPVMPGFTRCLRCCHGSYRSTMWTSSGRGPTRLICPATTFQN